MPEYAHPSRVSGLEASDDLEDVYAWHKWHPRPFAPGSVDLYGQRRTDMDLAEGDIQNRMPLSRGPPASSATACPSNMRSYLPPRTTPTPSIDLPVPPPRHMQTSVFPMWTMSSRVPQRLPPAYDSGAHKRSPAAWATACYIAHDGTEQYMRHQAPSSIDTMRLPPDPAAYQYHEPAPLRSARWGQRPDITADSMVSTSLGRSGGETADELHLDTGVSHSGLPPPPQTDRPLSLINPTVMLDPYSSSAREFIANRQILFLTKRRLRSQTTDPHVWIVNYYGSWTTRACSKVMPGKSFPIANTLYSASSLADSDGSSSRMARVLGYLEVDGESSPATGVAECNMKLDRLIGRGGTSAVFCGRLMSTLDSGRSVSTPAVIKMLHQKHWKCALAELVAAAAAIHRITENAWALSTILPSPPIFNPHACAEKTTSPSTAASSAIDSSNAYGAEVSPFLQGSVWLMPTELHLFWTLSAPPTSGNWSSSNHVGASALRQSTGIRRNTVASPFSSLHSRSSLSRGGSAAQPNFAARESPGLCCLVLRNVTEGVPLLSWLNSVFVKR